MNDSVFFYKSYKVLAIIVVNQIKVYLAMSFVLDKRSLDCNGFKESLEIETPKKKQWWFMLLSQINLITEWIGSQSLTLIGMSYESKKNAYL